MGSTKLQKLALVIIVTLVVGGIPACDFGRRPAVPTVNVTAPTSGTEVRVGEEVNVLLTGSDAKGIIRVELAVDGVLYRTDASSSPEGDRTLTLMQTWIATQPGVHTLTITAYNVDGTASVPWAITIKVVEGAGAEGTATPTLPAATPPPPPPPPPTVTPPPPTATAAPPPTPTEPAPPPEAPHIIYFRADGEEGTITVDPDTTVTLSWEWERVEAGYLDPGNIGLACPAMPCTYEVSPDATTTYTLRAINSAGTDEETVTVEVAAAAPLPDLYIAEFSLDPESPVVGEPVDVRVVVVNGGDASAGLFDVVFNYAGWHGFFWDDVGPLAAVEEAILERTYAFEVADPDTTVLVWVDPDGGSVEESDEGNNTFELMVNVQPS